jgi:hypothetical protein
MNDTWIKLYRKTGENGIMKDHTAWVLFSWLLINADKSGKMRVGRYKVADALGINPSTYYKVLQRLVKKWGVIRTVVAKEWTDVYVVNWGKYQHSRNEHGKALETKRQQGDNESNTIQEYKEYKNIKNILPADKPQALLKKRSPLQERNDRMIKHLETALNTKVTNYGKQLKALKMIFDAGYTEEQVIKTINYMRNKDEWYQDKGFDLMTVANQLPIYKAKFRNARKEEYVPEIN